MILYVLQNERVREQVQEVLAHHIPHPFTILRTKNGKPYVDGGIQFNYSHSGKVLCLAVNDTPVGVDVEVLKGVKHESILRRFCDEEREEIKSESDFLVHWTVREAFVKMKGETLAEYYNRLQYRGGTLYLDGVAQDVKLTTKRTDEYVLTVCEG